MTFNIFANYWKQFVSKLENIPLWPSYKCSLLFSKHHKIKSDYFCHCFFSLLFHSWLVWSLDTDSISGIPDTFNEFIVQICCPKALPWYPSVSPSIVCLCLQITCFCCLLYFLYSLYFEIFNALFSFVNQTSFLQDQKFCLCKCRTVVYWGPN